MAQYEIIKISELKPYEKNARTHSDEQIELLINSIREFGFINPVIIDENNMILVGHGRTIAAEKAGLEEVPFRRVEGLTEDQKRAYILADNKLSDLGGWDYDILAEELDNIELDMSDFGFDIEIDPIDPDPEPPAGDKYTKKVEIPQYEITGEEPDIGELWDNAKTAELIQEIQRAKITPEQKEFLTAAAQRHLAFNYKNIAEYYAHQNKEMQSLMEKSALVIIDFDDAIKYGYAALSDALDQMYAEDEDDDA